MDMLFRCLYVYKFKELSYMELLSVRVFFLNLFLIITASAGRRKREKYSGYKVYQANVSGVWSNEEIHEHFNDNDIDVWSYPTSFDPSYKIMVSPEADAHFRHITSLLTMNASVWIDDVGRLIATERRRRSRRQHRVFHYDQYNNYRQIHQWMKIFSDRNSDLVKLIQVGTTYRGRKIWALKITTSANRSKPVVWQDSLIHAREWISGAVTIWVTNKIVEELKVNNTAIQQFLDRFDFIVVPVWNVDGYIYTWNRKRLWRKSLRRTSNGKCYGVDLNRNFLTPNLNSKTACSSVYRGTYPFSEPETESVSRFLQSITLAVYITVHSFYQLWMYPHGFTNETCPDQSELEYVSRRVVRAMRSIHKKDYHQGSVQEIAYTVGGGSIDWVYSSLCVKHSYAVELRDRGDYGFLLPPNQITATAEEYYAGFRVLVDYVQTQSSFVSSDCKSKLNTIK